MSEEHNRISEIADQALLNFYGVSRELSREFAPLLLPSVQDMREHLARLMPKDFALATPPIPFPVRHGQTTASLSLGPLGPGTFGCPSGQILFLDAVSYSNTVVSDATGNSANSTPDPISATLHIRV